MGHPLKWDSAQTKMWEWDISEEICVKNDENRGQSKEKGKGKKKNKKNCKKRWFSIDFRSKNTIFC